MPIGIMIDSIAIASGACIGAALSKVFPQRLAKSLSQLFALSAMAIGITLIVDYQQLSAVILSLILGTAIGEAFNLNHRAKGISAKVDARFKQRFGNGPVDICIFINLVVMAACSGYGLFGALNEGLSANHAPLIAKAVLDFFTFFCFAITHGAVLSLICIPQFVIYFCIYLLAGFLSPFLDPVAMGDLSACAGVITMATGINLLWDLDIPLISMLPAFLLSVPFSNLFAMLL